MRFENNEESNLQHNSMRKLMRGKVPAKAICLKRLFPLRKK